MVTYLPISLLSMLFYCCLDNDFQPQKHLMHLFSRYWKLSLLVHPDKCTHPQAHQAFVLLNQAFKDLQDPDKVGLIMLH